jgi:hypothetical protein
MTIPKRTAKAAFVYAPPQAQINPDWFYRRAEGQAFFGLAQSQIDRQIELGNIPPLVFLSDEGRACFDEEIFEYLEQREHEKWLSRLACPWSAQGAKTVAVVHASRPRSPDLIQFRDAGHNALDLSRAATGICEGGGAIQQA